MSDPMSFSSSLIDDTKWCNDFRSFSRSKGPVNASIFRDVRIAWLKWKCSETRASRARNAVTVRRPRYEQCADCPLFGDSRMLAELGRRPHLHLAAGEYVDVEPLWLCEVGTHIRMNVRAADVCLMNRGEPLTISASVALASCGDRRPAVARRVSWTFGGEISPAEAAAALRLVDGESQHRVVSEEGRSGSGVVDASDPRCCRVRPIDSANKQGS